MIRNIIVICLLVISAKLNSSSIIVITDPMQRQNTIYRFELQSIYMLRYVEWDSGLPVVPIYMSFESDNHVKFVKHTLNLSIHNFRRDIESKIINGGAFKVYIAASKLEVLTLLKSIPGSIAYIDEYTILMGVDDDIKTISIID